MLPDGLVRVVHADGHSGTLEIVDRVNDAGRPVSSRPFDFQLTGTGDEEVRCPVL